MKKDFVMGKLPYESPTIETCDFMVEAGIAESYPMTGDKTAEDFTVSGWWNESFN